MQTIKYTKFRSKNYKSWLVYILITEQINNGN